MHADVLEQTARLQQMIDANKRTPRPIVDPRTLPVRFTRLKTFSLSAAHYLAACQDRSDDDSLALRMGSGFHAAVFGNKPLVCYEGRRAGKAWEAFETEHTERGAVILNEREYAIAAGMVEAIKSNDRAMELLYTGTTLERSIDWQIGSRACRSTPDADSPRILIDLKSTRSAEPRWLAREALRRHYHAQLAFYGDAIAHHRGKAPDEHYLVCVENVQPFCVVILRVPDETREVGSKLCRLWWEQLQLAEATGVYAGYLEHEIDLALPEWEQAGGEVEIDGELFDAQDGAA